MDLRHAPTKHTSARTRAARKTGELAGSSLQKWITNMPTKRFEPFACAAVLVCVTGFVACSSTTTGTGTPAGGKTGLFGGGGGTGTGGTSGTTTGGTSGTTSGGTTNVPTSCASAAADDSCVTCLKQACCSQTTTCGNNAECNAIFVCANSCATTDQACTNSCITAHPGGQAAVRDFVNCEQQFCVANCGGGSSSTSGGTTSGGTSGSSSVCQLASDQSVCADEPGRTTAENCPGGPPTAQCFAAPTTGISNIYCCPP
jgi:hypothetical protein